MSGTFSPVGHAFANLEIGDTSVLVNNHSSARIAEH